MTDIQDLFDLAAAAGFTVLCGLMFYGVVIGLA